MGMKIWTLYMLWILCISTRTHASMKKEDYLNKCLQSRYQKARPNEEAGLSSQCASYKQSSCCSSEVSNLLENADGWLGLDWNHCPGNPMPERCRKHFVRDTCFYECSPNKGPWIENVDMNIRKERFVNAPLCESECVDWWEDCKTAYTCLSRWDKGFDWTTGKNLCPTGSPCKPFTEIFGNSKTFCQNIWGGSWKVVPDNQPCIRLVFNGSNPNTRVAELKAEELANSNTANHNRNHHLRFLVELLFIFTLYYYR